MLDEQRRISLLHYIYLMKSIDHPKVLPLLGIAEENQLFGELIILKEGESLHH